MTLARSSARTRLWFHALLLAPLVLAGCSNSGEKDDGGDGGDGSDGGDGGVDPGAGSNTESLRFFSGSLKAIDPRSPGDIITIAEGDVMTATFATGEFSSQGSIDNARTEGILYVDSDNLRVVRSEVRAGQTPEDDLVAAIPSDAQALEFHSDFADPTKSQVVIEYDDDEFEVVRVDGTGGSQPFPGIPITDVFDTNDGTLLGWMAQQDDELVFVDVDLQSEFITTATDVVNVDQTFAGQIFLVIDGFVQVYDPADGSLTDSGYAVLGGFGEVDFASGGPDAFVLQIVPGGVEIARISPDGSVDKIFEDTNIATVPSFLCVPTLQTSGNNRLVFTYDTDAGCGIFSITRSGSDFVELGTGDIDLPTAFGSEVIFNKPVTEEAVVVNADGTKRKTFADSAWVGGTFESLDLGGLTLSDLFLVQGIEAGSVAGGVLHALDGNDPRTLATQLGTVPDDIDFLFLGFGTGDFRMAFGQSVVIDPADPFNFDSSTDVFLVETTKANSLVRITDTEDVDEFPIDF